MAADLFLGIEGGATRTSGVLTDEHMQVVARHATGPTNLYAVGEDDARAAVEELLHRLLHDAEAGWERIAASAFCVAGIRGPSDRARWERLVAAAGARPPLLLTHDAAAGLAAGSPDQTGILVVCGTGSLVYGRRADGAEHFVGGRGPILGDEGSGFDIGQRALRAAVRAADVTGDPTALECLIPERLGLENLDALVAWVSPFAKDRVAAVAPIVFEAAAAGDQVARHIADAAAAELASAVVAVATKLWPPGGGQAPKRIVYSGGVLRHQPRFLEALASLLRHHIPEAECTLPAVNGAVGAARLARRLARQGETEQ